MYGFGFLDSLDEKPIVFQVPDFGGRFWVYALYDARTDELEAAEQRRTLGADVFRSGAVLRTELRRLTAPVREGGS